jgi:flagellar motor protein MotB
MIPENRKPAGAEKRGEEKVKNKKVHAKKFHVKIGSPKNFKKEKKMKMTTKAIMTFTIGLGVLILMSCATTPDMTAKNREITVLQDRVTVLEKEKSDIYLAEMKTEQDQKNRLSQLRGLFTREIAAGDMDVKRYGDVLVVSIKESVFFTADSPALLAGNIPKNMLHRLADVFKKIPERTIRVEGNTAVGVSSTDSMKYFPTSWHLGAARAATVVNYLQLECGMDPMRLSVASFGQYRPRATNSTELGKETNRRVDFVIVDRPLWEKEQLKDAEMTLK